MIVYFRHEKARMERRQVAKATKGVGRPKVGGDFNLVDQNGKPFSNEDMKGRYSLVWQYFFHLKSRTYHIILTDGYRSTLASLIVPTFVPKNSTRWPS